MWKSQDTFSSACCVDSSNGAVYRLKNLWNSSEANATKWFLHLTNQVEVTRATRAISSTSRRELSSSPALQGKAPKEIDAILTETLGEHAPSYATVKNWVAQFKRGDFSTCDAPRPGRPKTVTTAEIIDQIHELIFEDRWISAKSIAEQLDISNERAESIIRVDLDMRKLSAKWVPKCLNSDQKRQTCQSSEQCLTFFRRDPNDFLSR